MRCDYCGFEFNYEEGKRGCNGCPVSNNCGKVKCPRCNYEIAVVKDFEVLDKVGKLFKKFFE